MRSTTPNHSDQLSAATWPLGTRSSTLVPRAWLIRSMHGVSLHALWSGIATCRTCSGASALATARLGRAGDCHGPWVCAGVTMTVTAAAAPGRRTDSASKSQQRRHMAAHWVLIRVTAAHWVPPAAAAASYAGDPWAWSELLHHGPRACMSVPSVANHERSWLKTQVEL
jgi:hypothetical protein